MVRFPNVWGYCEFCCDSENLYALDFDVNFKVNILRSVDCEKKLEISRRITFNSITVESIISSLCYNRKMYILYNYDYDYQFEKNQVSSRRNLDKQLCYVRLLVICTKTFTILNNFKIKDRLNIDKKLIDKSYSSGFANFLTIFHDRKSLKVFIYTGEKTPILVFDIQKENFYFVENTIGGPLDHFNSLEEFRTDYNNNIVYKLVVSEKLETVNHKITAYEYIDEKFIDTGFECDNFADWVSIYFV